MWSTSAIVALSAEVVVSGQFGLGYILHRSCKSVQHTVYSATFVRLGTPVTIHTKLMLASSCSCVCVCVCVCVGGWDGREVR